MDNSIRELEDISHLLDVAEEGLNQVDSKLAYLTTCQTGKNGIFAKLLTRAELLKTNLALMEEKRKLIITSRSDSHT